MVKATREAKVHTSWIHQNEAYQRAVERFVAETLAGHTAQSFLNAFVPLQHRIAQAGMINSLAQLALKLTSPGVPDFYQGTEFWDLSLVDPDNRRPVDFNVRQAMLDRLQPMIARLDGGEHVEREFEEAVGQLGRWTHQAVRHDARPGLQTNARRLVLARDVRGLGRRRASRRARRRVRTRATLQVRS
jgi:maltooligosyltrehalose synthase